MNSTRRQPIAVAALLFAALTGTARAEDTPAPTPAIQSIPYSGKIVSATGTVPEQAAIFADCQDGSERIHGQIEADTYRLDLPPAVTCTVVLGDTDWEADAQLVSDAATAIPQTMLIYPLPVPQPEIARELIEMGAQDRAVRQAWAAGKRDAASEKKFAADDRKRQRRLRQIITTKGWPTISMVGAEAANEAWLVAQHAPPAQLKHWAVFMRAAAARQEIKLVNLATTLDRVRMYEKRPQIYGTQYSTREDGAIQFYRIEDIANIDKRRLEMGMSTFAALQAQLAKPPKPAEPTKPAEPAPPVTPATPATPATAGE